MSQCFEFVTGCFACVSLESNYFRVMLRGNLPDNAPAAVDADNIGSILKVVSKSIPMTSLQWEEFADFLKSKGMQY